MTRRPNPDLIEASLQEETRALILAADTLLGRLDEAIRDDEARVEELTRTTELAATRAGRLARLYDAVSLIREEVTEALP